MKPEIAEDVVQKSRSIHGWFSTEAAMLFAWLDEIQRLNGITGDIFEIGCHHGKSTVMLSAMTRPQKEKICVCDLFDDQETNISGSGRGNLEIFKTNVHLFNNDLDVRILNKNSSDLSLEEIGNNYRFFHIDGGHNCEEALSDLRLAGDTLIEKGLIAIDDPFREDWPGVTEAVIRFLNEYHQYQAIIVGFNKLIIVRGDFNELYTKEILKIDRRRAYKLDYPWQLKELPFNGHPLQIFYSSTALSENNLALIFARQYYRYQNYFKNPLLRPFIGLTKAIFRKT